MIALRACVTFELRTDPCFTQLIDEAIEIKLDSVYFNNNLDFHFLPFFKQNYQNLHVAALMSMM